MRSRPNNAAQQRARVETRLHNLTRGGCRGVLEMEAVTDLGTTKESGDALEQTFD
jgi:hypothetical protein